MTNRLKHIFECSDHITEKQYRNSRTLFILDGCASTQIFTVTSGAFLSGLAYLVGAGTALTGVIAALPTLMNTVQIFSSVIYENRTGSKRITVEFALIQRLCLIMMLFVPTFMLGTKISVAMIAVLYSSAHFCGAFINTGANNWLISLVKNEQLGRYLGLKDSLTLVASTGGSLILSKILDSYRFTDREIMGFRVIGTLCVCICVIDIICLTLIREPKNVKHIDPLNIRKAIQMPLMDQNYHNVLIFFLLWSIASNFASPFFSIYMLENLELSYFYITSMNMIASVVRIAASNLWGRFADSCSWKLVTLGSIYMLGLAYIGWGLLTKENCSYWLPVVQAVSGAAWGGINIATFRMQFAFAPVEHRISYVSFCSTMVGFVGFFSSMLGSAFVAWEKKISILNIRMDTMQLVFIISVAGVIASALYSRNIKEK